MPLNFEIIRILIALGGTGLAAVQDYKTSFIDDKIVFSMIGAGAILTLATLDETLITYTFGIAAAIFVFGFLMYRRGQLGMGDVLLFVGLQLLLPFQPAITANLLPTGTQVFSIAAFEGMVSPNSPLFVSFNIVKHFTLFITVFMLSSYFAAVGTTISYAWKLRGKKLRPNKLYLGVSSALGLAMLFFLVGTFGLTLFTLLFIFLLVGMVFFVSFKDQLMREVIVRKLSIKEFEDEDVLYLEGMSQRLVKKYGLQRVLTKKEVAKLRKLQKAERVSKFPVLKDLPRFGPYILAGLIATLVLGDIFTIMVLLSY